MKEEIGERFYDTPCEGITLPSLVVLQPVVKSKRGEKKGCETLRVCRLVMRDA